MAVTFSIGSDREIEDTDSLSFPVGSPLPYSSPRML